jgi:hypothetical protein
MNWPPARSPHKPTSSHCGAYPAYSIPDVIVLETHGVRSELDQQAADRVAVQCLRHGL